ncbi:MAG: DNA internalization-related competence protein ComEC/Rec2, partial [Calditrichia bacterium]
VVVSFLPVSFRWQYGIMLFLLGVYAMLTGANPPVVRASLMVSIYAFGIILERKPDVFNTVFMAAFLILLVQPQQISWIGFQFSFAAVLAILIIYRRLQPLEQKLFSVLPPVFQKKWLKTYIIGAFLVSLAAQLGTIPLMVLHFHKIPLISFGLNLLVIPLIALIVPVGFLTVGISYLSFPLGELLGHLLSGLIQLLTGLVQRAADIPFAYLNLPALPFLALLLYLLLLILVLWWNSAAVKSLRKPALAVSIVLLLLLLAPQPRDADLILLDVGQGESSLLQTAGGNLLLFDAGPAFKNRDSGRDVIFPAMQHLGRLKLDKVFLSHPHADHIGGMFSLLKLAAIDSVYLPHLKTPYFWQDSLLNSLDKAGVAWRFLNCGDRVRVDEETCIYVLAPFPEFLHPRETRGDQINNCSLVMLLKSRNGSILFTGDAETPVEKRLTGWGDVLQANILKLGHHGSRTSSSHAFIEQVSPQFGLIPVGVHNRYGHPSTAVLEDLGRRRITFLRTDESGAVWLRQQGTNWRQIDWRN